MFTSRISALQTAAVMAIPVKQRRRPNNSQAETRMIWVCSNLYECRDSEGLHVRRPLKSFAKTTPRAKHATIVRTDTCRISANSQAMGCPARTRKTAEKPLP